MAALTDLSDLVNRATGGNNGTPASLWFYKAARIAGGAATATVAGRWSSLWRYEGTAGGAGAIPSAVATCTSATQGALLPFADPGGSRTKWLTHAMASSTQIGTLVLYDRLLQGGAYSGTNTGAQTVQGTGPTPPLSRNTSGVGNVMFVEIHTAIGSSGTTITAVYTNQAGTGSRTTTAVAIGGTGLNEATRVIMLPLQAGDSGVQVCKEVQLAGTTGTAGSFSLVIARPLAFLPIGIAGMTAWRDFVTGMPGIPAVEAASCLSLLWLANGTTAPEVTGALSFVEA